MKKRGRLGLYATRTPEGVALSAKADSVFPEMVIASTSRRSTSDASTKSEAAGERATERKSDHTWLTAGVLTLAALAIIINLIKKILLK